MALLDRITGAQENKISPHAFYGMMREMARGEVNRQYIVDNLVLDAEDEVELDWLIAQYTAKPDKPAWLLGMHSILMLAELGYAEYTNQAEIVAKITSL